MRAASVSADDLAAEVAGTSVGDTLRVTVWRGGNVAADNLDVSAWSLGWDATRQVHGQATLTIADPDGLLAPWAWDDALAPGGSRLTLTYTFGASGTTVPLGWWRIRKVTPVEQWRTYSVGGDVRRVAGGGTVTIAADEETASVVLDRLDPAQRTPTTTTALAEVRRLLADYMGLVVDPSLTDRTLPAGFTYAEGRMDAVEDLLDMLGATHRMAGDRTLQAVPIAGTSAGWTIDGGDDGALVSLGRTLDDNGVYNAVISSGQDPSGNPLVGRAYVTNGPLTWQGDYGRVPVFHQAIATSATGVQADAVTSLATLQAAGEVLLPVECLTHPGVQLHDVLTVIAATPAGDAALTGRVTAMTMTSATSDSGTTPAKRMTLTVAVGSGELAAVGMRVSRARG